MEKTVDKPYYDARIFWDTDPQALNYDKHAKYIIRRVFDRGDVMDIRYCRRFYPEPLIVNALTSAKYISQEAIRLAAAIFNTPLNSFRCYSPARSRTKK